jgi:hypothetical protein
VKTFLDRSAYRDSGFGEACAEIPRHAGDFSRAAAMALCVACKGCKREQEAVGAMKSVRKLSKLPPVRGLFFGEAGGCGMAGTFGLEVEHADFSLAVAQEAPLPRPRSTPDAELVANGFSCRQLIRAHAHRPPGCPDPVLRDALATAGAGG